LDGFLRGATQMLRTRPDPDLEQLSSRCIRAIIDSHFNPAFNLNNELLNHDLSRPTNDYARFVYTGHAIDTFWMVADEALRRGDQALFHLAVERFRHHLEVAWDRVYGGVYRGVRDVDQNTWLLDKVLWAQEEALIGCLLIYQHTRQEWAAEWFARIYSYVRDKYPLRPHGLPLWITFADRKVTLERHFHRIENYHHPRHLMMVLEILRAIRS